MRTIASPMPRDRAAGAALAIALVFLLVLTIVGVTAMRTTIMEERMAGNLRDYNLAFQAAEQALRAGEQWVESLGTLSGFDTTGPDYATGNAPDPFSAAAWSACTSVPGPSYLSANPCYFVEHVGTISSATPGADINIVGYGEQAGGGVVEGFRIVARAVGSTSAAEVILESRYGKRF